MTTNSPNPVDGDVQALIGLCKIEIKRWKAAAEANPNMRYMVTLMETALASLTAEPSDRIVDDGCSQRIGYVQVSDKLNCTWPLGTQFYTTPPAQLLRPVELPQRLSPCASGYGYSLTANDNGDAYSCSQVIDAIRAVGYEVKE